MLSQRAICALLCFSFLGVQSFVLAAKCSESDTVDAISRERLEQKYRGFLRSVRQKEDAKIRNAEAIQKLKNDKDDYQAKREEGRLDHIKRRNDKRAKINAEELDKKIRELQEKSAAERAARESRFVQIRNQKRASVANLPKVDPHDEYQVGNKYEDYEEDEEEAE